MNTKVRYIVGLSAAAVLFPAALVGCTPPPPVFSNCTLMHHQYPHGVGRANAVDHVTSGKPVTNFYRSTTIYNANVKAHPDLDRDHDGVACEAH